MVPALLISQRLLICEWDAEARKAPEVMRVLDFVGQPLQDSALARLPPAPHVCYFRQPSRAYLSVLSAFGICHSFPAALVAVAIRTKCKFVD